MNLEKHTKFFEKYINQWSFSYIKYPITNKEFWINFDLVYN